MKATRLSIFCIAVSLLACVYAVAQQTAQQDDSTKKPDNSKKNRLKKGSPETNARPMTDKERKAKEKQLRKELATPYRKWLNEDVTYIITDEERSAFVRLQTDEERESFIESFWLRRDPSPDTVENEFKEEHYRRIAYANEHFASGIPGWKTDREPHLYYIRSAGRNRRPLLGRQLQPASRRGRRRNFHLSIRTVALPLPGGHRHQHRH